MKKTYLALLIIAVFLSGCSSQRVAIKKDYDFSRIKRVAVLGFSSHMDYRNSGDVVADEFVLQLMNKGFKIVERSKINSILGEQQLYSANKIDEATIKKVGKILGVDAILTGSVIKYIEDKNTVIYYNDKEGNPASQSYLQLAEVSVNARLFDVETGEVVWSGSDHDSGLDISDAIYGVAFGLVNTIK
ncbi:MAG: GNA1162 family protein [Candidatus Firestonebacteria bacterium]